MDRRSLNKRVEAKLSKAVASQIERDRKVIARAKSLVTADQHARALAQLEKAAKLLSSGDRPGAERASTAARGILVEHVRGDKPSGEKPARPALKKRATKVIASEEQTLSMARRIVSTAMPWQAKSDQVRWANLVIERYESGRSIKNADDWLGSLMVGIEPEYID